MESYFVILLESKRYVAVKKAWIENPTVGSQTKIFFSENNEAVADFTLGNWFYLYPKIDAVYNGFVYREFGKFDTV